MSSIEQCIEQLDAVRESALDPRAAYVIRSRLERLLLSCARVTAERVGSTEPEMPGRVGQLLSAPSEVRRLAGACDTLHDLAGSVCRPSESLDARWEDGWSRISPALDELEAILRSYP
jgi:hypothetical protein